MLLNLTAILAGYLLGSIPSAYIVAKLRKGIDIRDVDIGNVGAGSTFRQVGLWEGAVVWIADMAKGAAAIFVAQALNVPQLWLFGAGFSAILGHCYPIYIAFRGGQGVSTIMGIFFILAPAAMTVTLGLMGILLLFTRHIFSMVCIIAPFLPLLIWLFQGSLATILYSLAIIIFVVFKNRHRLKEVRVVAIKNKE